MSKKSVGTKWENILANNMESNGFKVFKAQRTMKMIGPGRFISMANDLYGLFDLVAKQDGRTSWIQVKHDATGANTSTAKKPIMEFYLAWCNPEFEYCQIWQHIPRKGWKVFTASYETEDWKVHLLNNKFEIIEE